MGHHGKRFKTRQVEIILAMVRSGNSNLHRVGAHSPLDHLPLDKNERKQAIIPSFEEVQHNFRAPVAIGSQRSSSA